jgi:hypothetical protein
MPPRYDISKGATGKASKGALELFQIVKAKFPQWNISHVGIYNPRKIRGSRSSWSLHAEGRAIDFTIGLKGKEKEKALFELANWAVANADKYQIQEVIDYLHRRIWTSNKASQGWRKYNGDCSGTCTHVHIGLNRIGAKMEGDFKFDTTDTLIAEGKAIVSDVTDLNLSSIMIICALYLLSGLFVLNLFT